MSERWQEPTLFDGGHQFVIATMSFCPPNATDGGRWTYGYEIRDLISSETIELTANLRTFQGGAAIQLSDVLRDLMCRAEYHQLPFG